MSKAHSQAPKTLVASSPVLAMNRILWNPGRKVIDEIVLHDVAVVHIEQMDDGQWWIGIDLADGSSWAGDFTAQRGPMRFTQFESDVSWDHDAEHE